MATAFHPKWVIVIAFYNEANYIAPTVQCALAQDRDDIMLVCVDKITCARMLRLIEPAWQAKAARVRTLADAMRADNGAMSDLGFNGLPGETIQ